jgi:hypothetical protein
MKKSRLLEIIREEIAGALNEAGLYNLKNPSTDAKKGLPQTIDPDDATEKSPDFLRKYKKVSEIELEEDQLDEMAKITGKLESAIKNVIAKNSDLEGLALKKAIRKDAAVEDALEGDTMYDNQLNKFIALVKGEREVGQRGRKADPNKPKAEPKTPGVRGRKPMDSKPKASTTDMDDEEKEAAKAAGSDSTAKALGKMVPADKIEKFNLGLKFIKKYKDDKAKIDAYLKKASSEYKLPASMIKDLKKAAGREVGI